MDRSTPMHWFSFGATGDLAYKKIFPSLHAMVKHGRLNVPVIGVAKAGWSLDQLSARARDSVAKHGDADDAALREALRAAALRRRRLQRRRDVPSAGKSSAMPSVRRITWRFRPGLRPGGRTTRQSQLRTENARVIIEKPFGRDLASAHNLKSC